MNYYLEFANALADAASAVTTKYFTNPLITKTKQDTSLVTLADTEAEAVMRNMISAEFPAHGIWGEEGGQKFIKGEPNWILDPIDGTRAFIAGYPTFTTLVACEKNGENLVAIIDQPILKQRFSYEKSSKTLLNGQEISVSNVQSLSNAVVATTSSYYFSTAQSEWFNSIVNNAKGYVLGGDAYAYAMLACGRIDAVVDVGVKYYDIAAVIPIVRGAGGVVRITKKGEFYDIIASCSESLLSDLNIGDM